MIKTLFNITNKDVILMEQSGSANHLKLFRLTPFWMVKKKLDQLVKEIEDKLGDKKTSDTLEYEYRKTLAYQHLQILDALHLGILAEYGIKTRINAWKLIDGKNIKESEILKDLISKIKEHANIDIEEKDGFQRFEKHIVFKRDKFDQNFPPVKEAPKSNVTFEEIFISYMEASNSGLTENDRFLLFLTVKKDVDNRAKKQAAK